MFKSFQSLEQMQEYMAERSAAAEAAMTQEQRALSWGSFAMLPTPDMIVFGYVFTEDEMRQGELDAGASQEELEFTMRSTRGAMSRGYLFGRWSSPVEPTGELGSNHASSCWPIRSQDFNVAATFNWDAREMVRHPEGKWLLDAYIAMATATQGR